jgi:hypothetical protein
LLRLLLLQDLLEFTAAFTQLPRGLAVKLTPSRLLPAGHLLLLAAAQQLRSSSSSSSSSSSRDRRSNAANRTCFTPVQISLWMTHLSQIFKRPASPGTSPSSYKSSWSPDWELPYELRKQLATALLDYSGELRGQQGAWTPSALVSATVAAQELGLVAATGREWWAVVEETVLQDLESYKPAQLVRVLQCMAAAQYQPDPGAMEMHWLPAITGWFGSSSSSSSSSSLTGYRSAPEKRAAAAAAVLMVPQLIDLLEVLANLSHKPKDNAWWEAYQVTLQQQTRAVQQQQRWERQQQQQAVLSVQEVVRMVWSTGKLRLELKPTMLSCLLYQLELQPQQLQQLSSKQCVDVFVGLSKLVPKTPGVLQPRLYRELCEVLPNKWLGYKDITNLIRCMGGIADGTSEGSITGALISAAASNSSSSSRQQQQQLVAPRGVVLHLLSAAEPYLEKMQGRALSMLLWGVRKMGVQPPEGFLRR